LPEGSPLADAVVKEYLSRVSPHPLRPIPYVRGDWLAAMATRAPIYNDLLQLPLTITDLERRIDPAGNWTKPRRAGLTASQVVNCNRSVERRSTDTNFYWRTYDLVDKTTTGAAIFRLKNGLPGFFIADARGMRLDDLPANILQESVKSRPGNGRNGLSCMVCH